MEGVRGFTWATFEEKAREFESLSGWPPSRKPLSPNAGRLCREDMAIYGEEPAIDSLSLVVCGQCGRVVKSQALLQHQRLYHTDMVRVPAPYSAPPPLGGVHTIGQPSSAMSTSDSSSRYHSAGSGGVTGFTASQLPTSSGGRANKEYDPNKHCGVWIGGDKRHCTHSLTCKEHPVSERRKVMGRGRSFDELLDEHKKKKKMKKLEKLKSDADVFLNQTTHAHSPPLRSPTRSSHADPASPGSEETGEATRTAAPLTPNSVLDDFPKPLAVCSFGGRSQLSGGGLMMFSRRQDNLRSALAHLSGRSQDYTQTTLHRKHSYNSLLKQKRSQRKYFNHHQQRQASEESSSDRPSSLPLPLHPIPLPPTPSQPSGLTSPLYASAIISNISRGTPPTSLPLSVGGAASLGNPHPLIHTPVASTPQMAPSSGVPLDSLSSSNAHLANGDLSREMMETTDTETPLSVPPPTVGGQVEVPPVAPPTSAQTSKRTGKKKKKRGRRPKEKAQVDNSAMETLPGETEPGEIQQQVADQDGRTASQGVGVAAGGVSSHSVFHSGDDVLRTSREQMEIESQRNAVPSLAPPSNPHLLNNSFATEQAQPVSETSQSRLPEHRAGSTPSGTVGNEMSTPPRENAMVGLPLGFGGVVRVKQEPITNHEEEMETNPPLHSSQQTRTPVTKPQNVVLNGMVTPPSGSASPSLHHSFGSLNSQTFVINPTGQHSSPAGHPLMTSLSPHIGGLLPIRGSALFSTSPGLLASHAHQIQMMQQQSVLLQQLRQQQQQQQQHHIIQGGSLPSAQSPASLGGNIVTSRTNTPPMQNSIPPSGGLVMAASGHGFQHSFHVAGSESPLRSSSSGGNRIRAPISHIPSGNAPFQDVRGRPHLAAIGRNELPQSTSKSLLQSKQSLNPGAGAPRSHLPSQQVT